MNEASKKFNRLTTIKELLDWVAEPDLIKDRTERMVQVAEAFPVIKDFFTLVYQGPVFKDIVPYSPQQPVSKIPNRQELSFSEFISRYLKVVHPDALGTYQNKRSKFARMADYLDPRDFVMLTAGLQGSLAYEGDRINELVLKQAFPDLFPNA